MGIYPFNATITVPSSKSQTMRALLFAFLAEGRSIIYRPLLSNDTLAMIKAIKTLGAKIHLENHKIEILGTNANFSRLRQNRKPIIINACNSGIILRFLGTILGLSPYPSILTGDLSIQKNRPVGSLISGLRALGAKIKFLKLKNKPPFLIQGPITAGKITIDGKDSQPVSGFLIACSFLKGITEITVKNAGEKPWVDVTLNWLQKLKIPYEKRGYSYFKLLGSAKIKHFEYSVPADFSSLSYPLALAVLTNSFLEIKNLDFQDAQGDKDFIFILKKMGAKIEIDAEQKKLTVNSKNNFKHKTFCFNKPGLIAGTLGLKGLRIDAGKMIDMVPLLAVIGCFAQEKTIIYNAQICRFKESDRLTAITCELKKMGAKIEEKADGLIIYPSKLSGAELFSYHDHRIAMALSIAALSTADTSWIEKTECTNKTYPDFLKLLKNLKQKFEISN